MERLWARTAVAAALLLVGFAGLLGGAYAVRELTGTMPADRAREVQAGLIAAFAVVSLKGLLPQLLGTSVLLRLARRWVSERNASFLALSASVAVCAGLTYGWVAPLLLTVDHTSLPGLRPRNSGQHAANFALLTASVTAALLLARRWIPVADGATPE